VWDRCLHTLGSWNRRATTRVFSFVIPALLTALMMAAATEQATEWSPPMRGLRVRLVEVDEASGPGLVLELENVGRSSVTFTADLPRAMDTPSWGVQLAADWKGDGAFMFAGTGGSACPTCSHELSPGQRERFPLRVQWDVLRRAGARAPGPLRFRATFRARDPEPGVAQQWLGVIETPVLLTRVVEPPADE
jgi:hypothetical protein